MADLNKTKLDDLPFVLFNEAGSQDQVEQQEPRAEIKTGDLCPLCGLGHLEYNGVLNLECDHCKYSLGGCFT